MCTTSEIVTKTNVDNSTLVQPMGDQNSNRNEKVFNKGR